MQALEVASNARQIRLGEQVLFALVILDDEEFRHGFCQELLREGRAVVGQRKLDVERERLRVACNPAKDGLGFVQLLISQSRRGGANTCVALEPLHFLNLTLCLGFRARREILAEAFPVETGVELENDSPGGIREL